MRAISLAFVAGLASLPASVKRIREIPIDGKRADEVHRVAVAIGYPAEIDFPEPFASPPVCGDCGPSGLFKIEVLRDSFTIKPRLYPGPQPDGTIIKPAEFVTPIYVRLESRIALTVQVELAERDAADTRVVFTLPGRAAETAYVQQQVARAKAALEASFRTRLQAEVTREILRAFAEQHQCAQPKARVRRDDIVLEIKEVCRLGGKGYLRLQVENRDDARFSIGQVELRGIAEPTVYVAKRDLDPRAAATVVLGFPLQPGLRELQLTLSEIEGKHRELVIDRFGF